MAIGSSNSSSDDISQPSTTESFKWWKKVHANRQKKQVLKKLKRVKYWRVRKIVKANGMKIDKKKKQNFFSFIFSNSYSGFLFVVVAFQIHICNYSLASRKVSLNYTRETCWSDRFEWVFFFLTIATLFHWFPKRDESQQSQCVYSMAVKYRLGQFIKHFQSGTLAPNHFGTRLPHYKSVNKSDRLRWKLRSKMVWKRKNKMQNHWIYIKFTRFTFFSTLRLMQCISLCVFFFGESCATNHRHWQKHTFLALNHRQNIR